MFNKCCCPSFLLAGGGAYFFVLGVVWTDKFIVQPLVDIGFAGDPSMHEDGRVYNIARIFQSLGLAIDTLEEYYHEINKDGNLQLKLNEPHPRFFPYPTTFSEYGTTESQEVKFSYIYGSCTDPTNVTYFAKDESSDRNFVVKFVSRYGVKAHELLAGRGMAPRLLYFGLVDGKHDARNPQSDANGSTEVGGLYVGPIRMVIMEHAGRVTKEVPEDARSQVKNAVQTLHDEGFVYGDLREPNIMTSNSKVYLIGFDWAGEVGVARYPRHLSSSVTWPEAVQELELKPITREHDWFMFNQLFPPS
jgi:hypothetical protein